MTRYNEMGDRPHCNPDESPKDIPPLKYDHSSRSMTRCQADDDGHCTFMYCPQLRDKEPVTTGRHCPWDTTVEDE